MIEVLSWMIKSRLSLNKCLQKSLSFNPKFSPSSNILGIGTDIVHIPRFAQLLEKYPLQQPNSKIFKILGKFMHPLEIEELRRRSEFPKRENQLACYISGIWATKEAIYKSLSSNVKTGQLPPAQAIYTKLFYKTNDLDGKPLIKRITSSTEDRDYRDFTREYIDGSEFLISISHDGNYLISFVCHVKNS